MPKVRSPCSRSTLPWQSERLRIVKSKAQILLSRTIYAGKAVTLKMEKVAEPGGVRAWREIVCHPGSVVILPHLPDGSLLLVRQYRHAARQSLWELTAGTLEPGENSLNAARRELLEETGYLARSWTHLFDFYPSPGLLSERMQLFEAQGLERRQARLEADKRIRVKRFSRAELRTMLRLGKIRDAKTLVGLLWMFDTARWRA